MAEGKVLIVQGGWDGHTPKECADLFEGVLAADGFDVQVSDTLDSYTDTALMQSLNLIVPIWTMGELAGPQWAGLSEAVMSGVGIAGFHGGMIDAFRVNCGYNWMTGGQFVDHPGGIIPSHHVSIKDTEHEITRGVGGFDLPDTEQYYMHMDPAVHVLCETLVTGEHGDPSQYTPGTMMPYAWTKSWGRGRVFVAAWGHTDEDFKVPEAKQIVRRGMQWACKT